MKSVLSELDYRGLFDEISSQSAKSKVSVQISTEASSTLTHDYTAQFLKERNLPDDTAIGTLSKNARMAYIVGFALYVKEQGHSNKVVAQVLNRISKIKPEQIASIMLKAKSQFVMNQAREYDIRIDQMEKNQAGAIKALLDESVSTTYKRKGPVHWPTMLNVDGCGNVTAFIRDVAEKHGPPKYGEDGSVTNWPAGLDELVAKAIQSRTDAETTWKEVGKKIGIALSSTFGSRGKKATWDLELDPLLCVAADVQFDVDFDDDDETEE
jgi:hypothetical protein